MRSYLHCDWSKLPQFFKLPRHHKIEQDRWGSKAPLALQGGLSFAQVFCFIFVKDSLDVIPAVISCSPGLGLVPAMTQG